LPDTPFNLPFLNLQKRNDDQQQTPALPNLLDLNKVIGQTQQGVFGQATSAYCVASHPELYTYSFGAGAAVTFAALLVLVGFMSVVSWVSRKFRGF
jgi:hypothetical protein